MTKKIIYLTGFMASGKSTIGPILANTLGWNFFDLDKLIEEAAGKSIKKIFEENGEDYFRELETRTLRNTCELENYIIDGEEEPTKAEFIEKINSLLEKRIKYYDQADLKINTDNCQVGKTVDKLSHIIKKRIIWRK